ncbi:TetR/AcrR family transcriptional regulator [Pseudomonas sp. GD03858]|uniref:TetR/AcrR family transcriptional regulator n=1 Tax=unclassified Pseudomonas TaxID=196821 RepID=UPI00244746AC|nr:MULTISPECIES: TetR/AcrR family transcriptional regulator [unclassified Pseudomonas]MDH0648120.1 TetR/AcrR family transcriptional regulator [Pseudomonas sp. GD03867]MDH0665280.1 TetR/AcrR family transcriptional regulator [Pseudomonas sp. GD03858]
MKHAQLPRKVPTQARSRMMVETILKTTATMVVKHGYAGTNTNLVAERAGVSVGSVYQYFPNKDALIAALYERHAQAVNQIILDVAERQEVADLPSHITLLVRGLLQLHLQEPELHRMLDKDFAFLSNGASEHQARITHSMECLLQRWRHRLALGNLQSAAWLTAQMIMSMVKAYTLEAPQISQADIEEAICCSVTGLLCASPHSSFTQTGYLPGNIVTHSRLGAA